MQKLQTRFNLAIENLEFCSSRSGPAVHCVRCIAIICRIIVSDILPCRLEQMILGFVGAVFTIRLPLANESVTP